MMDTLDNYGEILLRQFGSTTVAAIRRSHTVPAGALPVPRERAFSATSLDSQSRTVAIQGQP